MLLSSASNYVCDYKLICLQERFETSISHKFSDDHHRFHFGHNSTEANYVGMMKM